MASRKEQLLNQFADMNVDPNKWISRAELYMYLDKRNGGSPYDRDIGNQIFERMDKNINGEVTVNDFIDIFMQAEEILKDKIQRTKADFLEYKEEREEVCYDLEQAES